jgi:glycosyltransferase involved in cell wall biosynthesis
MIFGHRVAVVLPAYNAAKTLEWTVAEIDRSIVDDVLLVDDCSKDDTVRRAEELGLEVIRHEKNLGYGGNQKTCYRAALSRGADIVVMLHPDYQYTPKLVPVMSHMIASGLYDVVLASRILGGTALKGGMPFYKYVANRFLTAFQNLCSGLKLSEYHTGYRAFSKDVLDRLPLELNDDDFIFDNQMIVQAGLAGFRFGEVSCPTKYFPEASSINFVRSTKYGLLCVKNSLLTLLARTGVYFAPFLRSRVFEQSNRERSLSALQ